MTKLIEFVLYAHNFNMQITLKAFYSRWERVRVCFAFQSDNVDDFRVLIEDDRLWLGRESRPTRNQLRIANLGAQTWQMAFHFMSFHLYVM